MAEEKSRLTDTLAGLETLLIHRVVIAFERSPESFLEEAHALELVIGLKKELSE
jgi:hypothetical protein